MSLKASSHPEPVIVSEKGLQSNPDCCINASKPTSHSNSQEISSIRKQPEVPASPCQTGTLSQAPSSPSVSVVITELHLSSIDWDALSFTAAPSPQSKHSKADPQPVNELDKGTRAGSSGSSTAVQSVCVESAAPQDNRVSEYSLMKRVHLKNFQKCTRNDESRAESVGSTLRSTDGQRAESEKPKAPLHTQSNLGYINTMAPDSKGGKITKTHQPKDSLPVKVPAQYKFVKTKPVNRPSNCPEKMIKISVCKKKSVCRRQDSLSDHSDVENRPQTKLQRAHRADVEPEPAPQLIKQERHNVVLNSVDRHHESNSTTPEKPPHNMGIPRINTLTQRYNIRSDDEDEDDDASICSPLPLAERLKLKFTK